MSDNPRETGVTRRKTYVKKPGIKEHYAYSSQVPHESERSNRDWKPNPYDRPRYTYTPEKSKSTSKSKTKKKTSKASTSNKERIQKSAIKRVESSSKEQMLATIKKAYKNIQGTKQTPGKDQTKGAGRKVIQKLEAELRSRGVSTATIRKQYK